MNNNPKVNSVAKNSLQRRIISVVSIAFLSLAGYFLASDYLTTLKHAQRLTLERLNGIVQHLAEVIDVDAHMELTNQYALKDQITTKDQDDNYQKIHNQLSLSYETHNLNSPIYTFVKTEKEKEFNFIASSSEVPYFRHTYSSFPEHAYAKLEQGGTIGIYKDEFGHWLTAFAPIKNNAGSIVGYVQADEKFDDFIAEVRNTTLWKAGLSLFGFGVIIVLLFPYLQRLLVNEERNKKLLTKALEETRLLTKKLETNEEQLKENAKKLEQSNKDLTDFAHIASHDLKAPIRNIASFSQLILRKTKGELDESVQEYLNFIIQNSSRAQKLINGLLSYSTADKDIGEPEHFSMLEATEIARQNLSSIIEEKNAQIEIDELPVINANSTLVSQVLQNLISNGIKYNESAHPEIKLGCGVCMEKGQYFYVKDNGIGIPDKYAHSIFKMFTRLHGNGEYEGSGIGLAFCDRVVGTYGGEMWLISEEDKGTTFFFTLPHARVEAKEAVLV